MIVLITLMRKKKKLNTPKVQATMFLALLLGMKSSMDETSIQT